MDSANGPSPSRKNARTRVASCENCRRRKLKCDRVQPCSNCVHRKEPNQCVWVTGARVLLRDTQPAESHVEERLRSIEGALQRLATHPPSVGPSVPSICPPAPYVRYTGPAGRSPDQPAHAETGDRDVFHFRTFNWKSIDAFPQGEGHWVRLSGALPKPDVVEQACVLFLAEANKHQHVIYEQDFWDRIWPSHQQALLSLAPVDEGQQLLTLSIILAICGLTQLTLSSRGDPLSQASPAFQSILALLRASAEALHFSSALDNPSFDTVRALLLQTWIAICLYSPSRVAAAISLLVSQMQQINLDRASAQEDATAAADRINMCITIVTLDWGLAGWCRRATLIHEHNVRIPLLAASALEECLQQGDVVPHEKRLMLEVARVNKRTMELGAVSPDQVLAIVWSTQSLIDQITKAQPVSYDDLMRSIQAGQWSPRTLQHCNVHVGMATSVLLLHKEFVARGYEETSHRTSRDLSYDSAQRLLRLLAAAFTCLVGVGDLAGMPAQELRRHVEARSGVVHEMGAVGNASVGASLVLLHHLSCLDALPSQTSTKQMQDTVIASLLTTARILYSMATVTSLGREGLGTIRNGLRKAVLSRSSHDALQHVEHLAADNASAALVPAPPPTNLQQLLDDVLGTTAAMPDLVFFAGTHPNNVYHDSSYGRQTGPASMHTW